MNLFKVLAAVISCTWFLFIQAKASTLEEQNRIQAQVQAEQKASDSTIHGNVVSVDPVAASIIIKTKRAQDTLTIASGAKIMLGRMELSKEIGLGDLFTGVKVTVAWKLIDGKKNAVKIVEESDFDTKKETH